MDYLACFAAKTASYQKRKATLEYYWLHLYFKGLFQVAISSGHFTRAV
jgi:hypothetical protein